MSQLEVDRINDDFTLVALSTSFALALHIFHNKMMPEICIMNLCCLFPGEVFDVKVFSEV